MTAAYYIRAECKSCVSWRPSPVADFGVCTSICHGLGCHPHPKEQSAAAQATTRPTPGYPRGMAVPRAAPSKLDTQVGGQHYKDLPIQPVEFIYANGIGYLEGCAIKYLVRWRNKNGLEDLRKAVHFIELLIELEGRAAASPR